MIAPKHEARSPSLLDCGLMAGTAGQALAMAELLCGRRAAPNDGSGQPPRGASAPSAEKPAEKTDR